MLFSHSRYKYSIEIFPSNFTKALLNNLKTVMSHLRGKKMCLSCIFVQKKMVPFEEGLKITKMFGIC